MIKNLEYYMQLPYTLLVKRDRDNEGNSCFIARVLEIPHILGDGSTAQEALECLHTHMQMAVEAYLKDGISIPEPQTEYSGNINIRVDPDLHASLAHEAAVYDMSLNKYTSLILERRQNYQFQKAATTKEPKTSKKKKIETKTSISGS